jgi:ubiquinone/menaquinone biosynthesis C-methylase UbiE
MLSLAEITSTYRTKLIVTAYRDWIKKGQKVLDIGCGNGVVSAKLIKDFDIDLTGCDIDKYLTHKIKFVKMKTVGNLPFDDMSFDVAMLNDVLHHTEKNNQQNLLNEALRVSKQVAVFEVNPTVLGIIFDFIMNKIHHFRMNIPFTFRTNNEWIRLFIKNDYKYIIKQVQKPFLYPFKHVAYLLTKKYGKKN